jgi:hypothetical protein
LNPTRPAEKSRARVPGDFDFRPDSQRVGLFGGPYLEAAVDSEQLVMKHEGLRRTLDFRILSIRDEGTR